MSEEQLYARWLDVGTRIGFVVLLVSFFAYVLGLLDPLVPPRELARLWGLPVDRYVAAVKGPTGWGWLGLLARSDDLNYLGVALLASVSAVAYARIVPTLIAQGDRLRAGIAALQIVVLVTAALAF
jgi:hypothetical protein